MFERFTDKGRQVLVAAKQESIRMGSGGIEPYHVLLGLTEGDGVAAAVLRDLGIGRSDIERAIPAPEPSTRKRSNPPFTKPAKKALELALREALQLGHNYIGTEHLLLGVVRGQDRAALLLADRGLDLTTARAAV